MNIKDFRITKLDRRMNGYGMWTHRIVPIDLADMLRLREWLWENYGPGAEWSWARWTHRDSCEWSNPYVWAWQTDHGYRRIFVNQEILSHFILKFSN